MIANECSTILKKVSKPGTFGDNCCTISYKELKNNKYTYYDCYNADESRHCMVNRLDCLDLVENGDIEWKIINGKRIINETGFKGNRPNSGYGKYFPSIDINREFS